MSAVLTLVNSLVSLVALAVLAYLVTQNKVSAGSLLAVTSLIPSFGSSVMEYLSESEFYKSGLALFDEKFGFAQGWSKAQDISQIYEKNDDEKIDRLQDILLEDIRLNFEPPLEFPTLHFYQGKKYAIMGESGSGKSSLLKVLLGELDDYAGEVFVNGKPKTKHANLFNQIAYVNQETFLFNDTVKNNIDLDNCLTDDEVSHLLKQIGLSHVTPHTEIKENGKNLSGGQRQRLALARALARGKEILVLDEATANLDEQTTQLIHDIVLNSDKTVLMITHRMSDADRMRFNEIIQLT